MLVLLLQMLVISIQTNLRDQVSNESVLYMTSAYYLSHIFHDERYTLLSTLNNSDCKIIELTNSSLSQTLWYGSTLFDKEKNALIIKTIIEYISSTEGFKELHI